MKVVLGKPFKPAEELKKLYYIYSILILLFGFLIWYAPFTLLIPPIINIPTYSILILTMLFVFWWIPKYYESISFIITKEEIVWRRGVWFKKTGIVPYNRITNLDTSQGPISRMFKVGSIKVQTAGYSGQTPAEIKIECIKEFEELRELIMKFVRENKPAATETFQGKNPNKEILTELVKIRKTLEKK